MEQFAKISKWLLLMSLVLFIWPGGVARGEVLSDNLAQMEQLQAPEKMIIDIISVRKNSKGFLWGPTANQEVEIEARVVEIDRSKSGMVPGSIIRIRYERPTMASTELSPPPIPKQGRSTPAFLVKRGEWFYPVAHHLSFSPMTKQQRQDLLVMEQMKAERKAKEELLLNTESEILGGLEPPSIDEEASVPAGMVMEDNKVEEELLQTISLDSLEDVTPIEDAVVAVAEGPEGEVIENPEVQKVWDQKAARSDFTQDQEAENNRIREKIDAEMIARNEARRRRAKSESEMKQARKMVVQERSRRSQGIIPETSFSSPSLAITNENYTLDMDQPMRNSNPEIVATTPIQSIESKPPSMMIEEVNPEEEVQIIVERVEDETTEAQEITLVKGTEAMIEESVTIRKKEEILREVHNQNRVIEIEDEELDIPESPRITMKQKSEPHLQPEQVKEQAVEEALVETTSAGLQEFDAEVEKIAPKSESIEENLKFIPIEERKSVESQAIEKVAAVQKANEQATSSLLKPDPRRLVYKRYFSMIQDGEIAHLQGDLKKTIEYYRAAANGLERLKQEEPDFYPEVVDFRLMDCKKRLENVLIEEKARASIDSQE